MTPTTEPALRIGALFRRRPTTPWSEKEVRQYKKLYKCGCFNSLTDLSLIERYYVFERRKGEKGFHRRDLQTFLNNYPSELDRAKAWTESSRSSRSAPSRYQSNGGVKPCTDQEFVRIGDLARKQVEELRERLRNPLSNVQQSP